MIIEAGKRYNRRDGGISGIIVENNTGRYTETHTFKDSDSAYTYKPSGQYLVAHDDVDSLDLISEYIEPTAEEKAAKDAAMLGTGFYKRMSDGTTEYLRPEDIVMAKNVEQEPTAASVTDEWGPWIGWNGGECPVDPDAKIQAVWRTHKGRNGGEYTATSVNWQRDELDHNLDCPVAYRIKKEPEVREITAFITDDGSIFSESYGLTSHTHRKAIITTQGDKISARWADKGEVK